MRWLSVLIALTLTVTVSAIAQQIPAGTVIPVMMTSTIDSAKSHAGQPITGKIMEVVPLADGSDIPAGAKIFGHVTQAIAGQGGSPASLAVRLDRVMVGGHAMAITGRLRALASMMAVYEAQVPLFEPDTTPRSSVMVAPVGGDAAFRPDNPEQAYRRLVRFSGELPDGCGTRVDREEGTGALWVFSPYACGVYGFGKGVVIVQDGSAYPAGTIVLGSQKNFSVHAGSGWLLQMQPPSSATQASSTE